MEGRKAWGAAWLDRGGWGDSWSKRDQGERNLGVAAGADPCVNQGMWGLESMGQLHCLSNSPIFNGHPDKDIWESGKSLEVVLFKENDAESSRQNNLFLLDGGAIIVQRKDGTLNSDLFLNGRIKASLCFKSPFGCRNNCWVWLDFYGGLQRINPSILGLRKTERASLDSCSLAPFEFQQGDPVQVEPLISVINLKRGGPMGLSLKNKIVEIVENEERVIWVSDEEGVPTPPRRRGRPKKIGVLSSGKGRGRPKGSKNKPKDSLSNVDVITPPSSQMDWELEVPIDPAPSVPTSRTVVLSDQNQLVPFLPSFHQPTGVFTRARSALSVGKRLGLAYDCSDEFAFNDMVAKFSSRRP